MLASTFPPARRTHPSHRVSAVLALTVMGAVLVLLGGAWALPFVVRVPSTGSAPPTGSPPPTGSAPPALPVAATLPTVIRHIILVMEENHDLNWTLTDPTFNSIYSHNAHATHAYAVCHPSAPNYIAASSAAKLQCGSDGVSYYSDTSLASALVNRSLAWQGLMESMPSACDRSDAYPYIAHHNPWLYYSNLKATCASNDLSFFTSTGASRLQAELNGTSLPALTFVSPNMLHDAHDGTLVAASSWLTKYVLNPVKSSSKYAASTLVLVVFDEAYKKSCACSENGGYSSGGVTVSGGPIYLVAVSSILPLNLAVTVDVTFFNIVGTIEWLLALPSLHHDDNSHFPAITGLVK